MSKFKKPTTLFLFVIIIAIIASFFIFLWNIYNADKMQLASRILSLESQVQSLSKALQGSSSLNEENERQLKELSDRSAIITKSQDELLTSVVSKAVPAVVSIVVSKDVPLLEVTYENPFGNDPLFKNFGIRLPTYRQVGTQKQQIGAGTGFIIRSDGYIITNRHVVDDIQAEYTVLLSSGEQKKASVIYRDDKFDLAIVKIDGIKFKALILGDSSMALLGQTVTAIGNALGEYNNSISVGIISGLNRTIQVQDNYGVVETLEGVLQTDAAINRGNSGGPLLDLSGNVVGVNVAMEQAANNIAFAIPIDTVKPIIEKILP